MHHLASNHPSSCLVGQGLTRRSWLGLSAAGVCGLSVSGWFDALAAEAKQPRGKGKACILLWMDGGPSQAHTFDIKPSRKDYESTKPVATSAPGLTIGEHLPELAKHGTELAVLR